MAQITLVPPDSHTKELTTRDENAESGWSPKRLFDAINTMFTEVYASLTTQGGEIDALQGKVIELAVGDADDIYDIYGDGAPDASAQAELTVNPTGDDNSLTFTAVAFGTGGNDISIEYVDPGTPLSALSVSVVGSAITVSLETDDSEPTPAILSTAAEVLAAIEGEAEAAALVTVAIDATDTGAGDDGSGVVTEMALDNLAGGTGVGVGVAGTGSRYTDITAGELYINTGDIDEPVWTQLAPV